MFSGIQAVFVNSQEFQAEAMPKLIRQIVFIEGKV